MCVYLNIRYARIQTDRYWVILSLAEAETVRGLMHAKRGRPVIDNTHVCLGLRANEALLDGSFKYVSAFNYQQAMMKSLLKFINAEMYYPENELNIQLRALQHDPIKERELWFQEMRACRRRTSKS